MLFEPSSPRNANLPPVRPLIHRKEYAMNPASHTDRHFSLFYQTVSKVSLTLGAVALVLLAIPVALDIVLRHTGAYFAGAFEIQELMMGLLTVCGMTVIACRDRHIAIDFFYAKFPAGLQRFLDALFEFMGFVFFSMLGWQILSLAAEKSSGGEITPVMHIPLFIPVFIFGCCMSLFALVLLFNCLEKFRAVQRAGRSAEIPAILLVTALAAALPWILEACDVDISRSRLGVLGMSGFMCILFLGFPLGYAMGISGFLGLLCLNPDILAQFSTLSQTSYNAAFSSTMAVVPLFCLMGELSVVSGISGDMFSAARIWMGRTPASLGIAGITGCAGFAAICGDSLATGVTMASVALPEMRKQGYDPAFSCATLACGGTLGVLIPPSLSFIIYAIITETSTGRLFMAGVVPGLMLSGMFILLLLFMARRRPDLLPRGRAYSMAEKFRSLKGVIAVILLIFIIMGGILAGFFSATEAGAIGSVAVWLFALSMGRINWRQTRLCLEHTVLIAGKLMFILMCVALLGVFIAYTRLTVTLAGTVAGLDVNRYVILAVIIGFYMLMGCMMNVLPLLLLTLPTIFPAVQSLGFDPVWFGVIIVLLTEMAVITPPVGINVFGIGSMARDVPLAAIFRNVWLFFSCIALQILLIILFPQIALWLPALFFQ